MRAAKIFDDWSAEALKFAKDSKKVDVIELSPAVRKEMFSAAKPVIDKTIASLQEQGIADARKIYDALNK
jgi:hypothetical protein